MSMTLTQFLSIIQLIADVINNLFNSMDAIIVINTSPTWSLLDFEIITMIYLELRILLEELTH